MAGRSEQGVARRGWRLRTHLVDLTLIISRQKPRCLDERPAELYKRDLSLGDIISAEWAHSKALGDL